MGKQLETLEQYDYSDSDIMDKYWRRYAPLIGEYIIKFSYLEHELNIALSEYIGRSRSHDEGYVVISKLRMRNKIDLFYSFYCGLERCKKNDKTKTLLEQIKAGMIQANSFRNILVHSDLYSLEKDYTIRSKIVIDDFDDYQVKFERIKFTTTIIRKKIKELSKTINQLDKYDMIAWEGV